MKPDVNGRAARRIALAIVAAATAAGVAPALAHEASDLWLGVGILRLEPRSSSGPLVVTEVAGMPTEQPQAGSGVKVLGATTLSLTGEWFWSDRVSIQGVFGVPPRHRLRGEGTLAGAGVIGEGTQYSPTVLAKWHFGDPGDRLRPYLGLGLNYTWFRQTRITNDAFRQVSYGPDATTTVAVSPSWNPVASGGLDIRLGERLSLALSIGYAPLKTTMTVNAENTMFGSSMKVRTDVRLRTLAGGLALNYRL